MNDRELLEWAAKAIDGEVFHYGECWRHPNGYEWNPLLNDGDALCLAVGLGIEIYPDREVNEVQTAYCVGRIGYNTREEVGAHGGDWMKATRRAIVRAAAEIGKAMP